MVKSTFLKFPRKGKGYTVVFTGNNNISSERRFKTRKKAMEAVRKYIA